MLDFPLRLRGPVVERIRPQTNKLAMGVEKETTGASKLNDSPELEL